MKSTGIVRKVDPLGRIVIPKEIRKTHDVNIDDSMEIFIDGELIILKKYSAYKTCFITGDVLDSNIEYVPGLFLSPRGVEILKQKLK